jgi:hypothetical protein
MKIYLSSGLHLERVVILAVSVRSSDLLSELGGIELAQEASTPHSSRSTTFVSIGSSPLVVTRRKGITGASSSGEL